MNHHLPLPVVYTADIGALLGVLGSVFGILPGVVGVVAAFLGGVFYAIQIWDRLFGKENPH